MARGVGRGMGESGARADERKGLGHVVWRASFRPGARTFADTGSPGFRPP
jgi:hypothetical protein